MTFLIDVLVVWRLTHLIQSEDGPFDICFKFKAWVSKHSPFWFELVKCFYCLSVWFGLLVAGIRKGPGLTGFTLSNLAYAIALSGAAILLQLVSGDK